MKEENNEKYLGKFTTDEFNLLSWSSKRKGEMVGEKNGKNVYAVYISKSGWDERLKSNNLTL